jgi:hypothetical protein
MHAKGLKCNNIKSQKKVEKTGFCDLWDFKISITLIFAAIEKVIYQVPTTTPALRQFAISQNYWQFMEETSRKILYGELCWSLWGYKFKRLAL